MKSVICLQVETQSETNQVGHYLSQFNYTYIG
jgi:hypothetical protein